MQGFGPVRGLADEFGLVQTSRLRGFEFVLQIAQFVRPTALVRHGRPQPAQGLDQTGLTISNH